MEHSRGALLGRTQALPKEFWNFVSQLHRWLNPCIYMDIPDGRCCAGLLGHPESSSLLVAHGSAL